jgi:hypothetical protein
MVGSPAAQSAEMSLMFGPKLDSIGEGEFGLEAAWSSVVEGVKALRIVVGINESEQFGTGVGGAGESPVL